MRKKVFGVRITVVIPEAKTWDEARHIVAQLLKTGAEYSLYKYEICGDIEKYDSVK